MRVAKKQPGVKRRRYAKNHPLVLADFNIRDDGTWVVTIPVYTYNPNNGSTGHTRWAGIQRSKARKTQRAQVGLYLMLNSVPKYFRGVRITRLAPSEGLDTGGLWAALKAPQDAVAEHLGIDDGPKSPATWEVAQERAKAYGVRVELRADRATAAND